MSFFDEFHPIGHQNGVDFYKKSCNCLLLDRPAEETDESALDVTMKLILNEHAIPRVDSISEKTMDILHKIPAKAVIKVTDNLKKSDVSLNHYDCPLIYWNKELEEGYIIYIPNVEIKDLNETNLYI